MAAAAVPASSPVPEVRIEMGSRRERRRARSEERHSLEQTVALIGHQTIAQNGELVQLRRDLAAFKKETRRDLCLNSGALVAVGALVLIGYTMAAFVFYNMAFKKN